MRKAIARVKVGVSVSEGCCREIRSAESKERIEAFEAEVVGRTFEKEPLRRVQSDRTKTDTGRWGEDPKALERTFVKELGKITP